MTSSPPSRPSAGELLDDIRWRGLVAQSTDLEALQATLSAGPITLYCGFDPTAPSLHLGHLVQLLTVRRFQLAGHRPLGLVGGATGLIGDPRMSGERVLHDADVVAGWVYRIQAQVERFLDFDESPSGAIIVNNLDWTADLSSITFLRDIGKHFSVNRMLDRESVAARLAGPGISYTEFSYQLLQSYDYLELFRRYDCRLQTGGSDQWGNITAGVDLIRRVEQQSVHALTTPLLTKSDGSKFGKSETGTLWLDPSLTSAYAFYQYWVNVEDADVVRLLKALTFLGRDEIVALESATDERPHAREAGRRLAAEVTTLVHGSEETARVEAASAALFGRGELADLDPRTLGAAMAEVTSVRVPATALPPVADLLVATGLVASRSAARRAIAEGGISVNNVRVGASEGRTRGNGVRGDTEGTEGTGGADPTPSADQLVHGRWLVLRRGRRHVAGVEVV